MPLPPPGKTEWPPKAMERAYRQYEVHSAWYGGDPDVLASLYGAESGGIDLADVKYRASQFRGGVVGRAARWWWGTPPPAGELRTKLHLPLASDIATMSADLLFAEPPRVTARDRVTQERLDELAEDGGLQSLLIEGGEVAAALGDVYLVHTWDRSLRDHAWMRVVHADAVVPEFRGGLLTAATVWAVVREEDGGRVWRHLERHERGRILHGLYLGGARHLGRLMELGDAPETEGLEPEVVTGVDALTVEHVPNMRPNRLDRSSPLGRSDYSPGALTLMDQLDEVWSSLAREFRLAKARGVVTADALHPLGPGQGATVEADREFFAPLNVDPRTVTGDPVRLLQPLIRVEEHIAGARAITEQIVRSCGYSLQSFGEASGVAATATEIQQRERLSYLTRSKKALHWGRLSRALETLLAIDNAVYGRKTPVERPTVEFGDSVAESMDTMAQTLSLLAQAEAASTETRVRILRPEWDASEVAEEVARIYREKGLDVPDPEQVVRQPPADGLGTPAVN